MLINDIFSSANFQQIERVFQRLSRLVDKHYGSDLLYFPLTQLRRISTPQKSRARLLLHLCHSKQPIVLDQRLYIPLWQQGQVTGVIEIRRKSSHSTPQLSSTEVKRLHDFITLTLESGLPLERGLQTPSRGPYLIQYTSKASLLKTALEIHEAHKNLALVEFHQLGLDVSGQAQELLELNSITLLVPELQRLSLRQTKALKELLNNLSLPLSHSQSGPLVIAGTQHSLADIADSKTLTQIFARGSYLNLNLSAESTKKADQPTKQDPPYLHS